MASRSRLLSETHVMCSICLEVFNEPTSIPCGHNFCKVCISNYWDTTDLCQCPLCKHTFDRRPQLHVNTTIREVVENVKKMKIGDVENCPTGPGEVSCDVCTGTKLKALKSCLVCQTSYCETHLEPHLRVPALKKHKLIDPLEEECGQRKTKLAKMMADIDQLMTTRCVKVQEIKLSVETRKRDTEREISDSSEVFTALVNSIQRSQSELIQVIEDKQKAAEKQAEGFIKYLEQEITELKRRSSELEKLSHSEDHIHPHTKDHIHFLQGFPSLSTPPHTKDWSQISVHRDLSVGTVRRAVSQLEDTVRMEIKKLCEAELKRIQQYGVDVTPNADTAHPQLILSEDGKQVRMGDTKKKMRDNPERFDTSANVLGKQGFSSGRFYYEVQVWGKTKWELGVARESINRKGDITLRPTYGYWAIVQRNEEYMAAAGPAVPLSLREKPQKVGVFVDYEEGQVSFYNVESKSHIYTYTGCNFTEKIYPFLGPGLKHRGKNAAPLIITPVTHPVAAPEDCDWGSWAERPPSLVPSAPPLHQAGLFVGEAMSFDSTYI